MATPIMADEENDEWQGSIAALKQSVKKHFKKLTKRLNGDVKVSILN